VHADATIVQVGRGTVAGLPRVIDLAGVGTRRSEAPKRGHGTDRRWLLALLLLIVPAPAGAQVPDASLEWRTLSTPHFEVHYPLPLGVLARRVAELAERAQGTLSEVIGYEAGRRTHIVLSDPTDAANGSATALPRNTVRLFASAPESMSTLGDHDDWMAVLVNHEQTHVVHLDSWGGVASLINLFLGKTYAPNHVQPRWLIEGYATWQESERSAGGRVRSTMFDMYLRADALEDRFWDIDQLSTIADRWPHGSAWYLYGAFFVRYLADRFGREALARFAQEYGREAIPYGLNRVASRAFGVPLTRLYADFQAERRAHYQAQVAAAGPLAEGRRLTRHGEIARLPRFAPDGRLYYRRTDNRSRSVVEAFHLPAADQLPEAEGWSRLAGSPGHALHPDGRTLIVSRRANHRDIYQFHDLFRVDLDTGRSERLTQGLRAREPDVSPDGRHVAFTVNDAGTTTLYLADLADVPGTARPLLRSRRWEQVFNPRFSPDGRQIAFSRWQRGGYRDIWLFDRAEGRLTAVTHDRAMDTAPAWSADGETLYFSSDRTGIANVYAYRLRRGTLTQLTNVATGAYQPAVSPDGETLVYVGYTSFGFDLFRLPMAEALNAPAAPYRDRRPGTPAALNPPLFAGPSRPYRPLESLGPYQVLLELADNGFGPALGVSVGGEDFAGFHRWTGRASVGLTRDPAFNVALRYEYRRSPLRFAGTLFRQVSRRGGLRLNGRDEVWTEEAHGGDLGLSYGLPGVFRNQVLGASYSLTHLSAADPLLARAPPDPNQPPPVVPELGWLGRLRLSWSYSDVERYLYDISASNGTSLAVSLGVSDPLLGSQFRAVTFTWALTRFVPLPWASHHVLALRYGGGLSGGDLGRRGAFSVGGHAPATPLDGLLDGVILGGTALRGYAPFSRRGTQFHLAQVEYRLPLWRINRGPWTAPAYLNRVYGAIFVDAGDAFFGAFDIETFRVGAGAEVLVDFTVGYLLPFTLRVGYARGVMDGGDHQVYAHLGRPF
jgi:dipeptidyl aminopeptidase/acylaminoacyl peptidase